MQHTHDFPVGGIVQMTSAPHLVKTGPYTITRLMPEGRDGEPQYRIKSEDGKVERVVTQADIVAAPACRRTFSAPDHILQGGRTMPMRTHIVYADDQPESNDNFIQSPVHSHVVGEGGSRRISGSTRLAYAG